ncbi:hypothetical protein [Ferrovibrio sp.]|uniref:hypothetical protein n=1 Tax=Ferrovibrio sp. TaxID=1917215 RepID=UPI0026380533|nr:hypothetical protein [Ferrovibrio sp.]
MSIKTTQQKVTHALPDEPEVLAAIGRIALRHGQLDNQLKMLIRSLTGVSKEEALDATRRNGSSELRDRINKLARKRLGEGTPLVKLQALLTRAAQATEKRNQLLHGVWGTDLDGNLMIRGDTNNFDKAPSVEELEKLDDIIISILVDVVEARMNGFLFDALQNTKRD